MLITFSMTRYLRGYNLKDVFLNKKLLCTMLLLKHCRFPAVLDIRIVVIPCLLAILANL